MLEGKFIRNILHGLKKNKQKSQHLIISNVELKELLGVHDITGTIEERRMCWFGCVWTSQSISNDVPKWKLEDKRSLGKTKKKKKPMMWNIKE